MNRHAASDRVDAQARVRAGGRHGLEDMFVRTCRAGQAEIHHAGAAAVIDEHVLGLEVAVDEAALVRGLQAPAALQEHGDDVLPAARGRGEPGLEGAALDELEREVDLAAWVPASTTCGTFGSEIFAIAWGSRSRRL